MYCVIFRLEADNYKLHKIQHSHATEMLHETSVRDSHVTRMLHETYVGEELGEYRRKYVATACALVRVEQQVCGTDMFRPTSVT